MKFFLVAFVIAALYTTVTSGMSEKTDLKCMVESIDTAASFNADVGEIWTQEVRDELVVIRDIWINCKSTHDPEACKHNEAKRFTQPYSNFFSNVFRRNAPIGMALMTSVRKCGVFDL